MAHKKMILTQAGVQSYRTRMMVGDPVVLSASDAVRLEKIGWVEAPKRARRPAPAPQLADERPALREAYRTKFGRAAFNGWDADTLREKIAEA
jgi:hypothetical protein